MSRNTVITILVVLVILVGGWWLMRPKNTSAPTPVTVESTPTSQSTAAPSASEGAMVKEDKNLVTITTSEFSPKDITIKVGGTVTWVNSDSNDHTVNSAPHPTHTTYPPLNLNVIKPGEKKSLQFTQAGTFKYHDHLNPSLVGSVTVQ